MTSLFTTQLTPSPQALKALHAMSGRWRNQAAAKWRLWWFMIANLVVAAMTSDAVCATGFAASLTNGLANGFTNELAGYEPLLYSPLSFELVECMELEHAAFAASPFAESALFQVIRAEWETEFVLHSGLHSGLYSGLHSGLHPFPSSFFSPSIPASFFAASPASDSTEDDDDKPAPLDSVALRRREFLVADTIVHLKELRESLRLDSLGLRSLNVGAPVQRANQFSRWFSAGYNFSGLLDTLATRTSGGGRVQMQLRETMHGAEVATPQTVPLEEYISRRTQYLRGALIDSAFRFYDIKRTSRYEFANVLGQIGNINLPVPQSPITGIFGKPDIRINLNAEYNVKLGVSWTTQNLGTTSAFGQTQFAPIFSQDIQANPSISIGDKVRINLDYNTKRLFEFDNVTSIGFDGDADDIMKRVELGNVQFTTPSTFIGSSQALFGGRVDMQFGPLYLKTVFSQKRGQRKSVSLTGGSTRQPFTLRAYDYAENNFLLDTAYKAIFTAAMSQPSGQPTSQPVNTPNASRLAIVTCEVWESVPNVAEQATASPAIAYADLQPRSSAGESYPPAIINGDTVTTAGIVERGMFRLLPETQYSLDKITGRLTITQLRRDRTYAVAYRIQNTTLDEKDDLFYGTILGSNTGTAFATTATTTQPTRVLKLVYRPNLQPAFKSLWARQMRNVYNIGAGNVDIAQTRIGIAYYTKSNDSVDALPGYEKIVTVLGVDRLNNSDGTVKPDGQFDIATAGATQTPVFNAQRGEIVFPSLEPFRARLQEYFASKGKPQDAEQYVYSAVYDTTRDAARLAIDRDRFVISGEVTGSSSTGGKFQIPQAFNLAPGSVKVTLNGAPLQEYADFRVEYFTGQVTVINPNAFLPNARLEVEYEQNDPFNIATKTILGLRADLDLKTILRSRTFSGSIGLTAMNYNQALVTDRVRVGEESMNNLMIGVDGNFSTELPLVTKALGAIFDTKAASSITGRGEVAMMLPDPNKRRSDIPSDGGKPVVYIDDFESGQRPLAFGLQTAQWSFASPPFGDEVVYKGSTDSAAVAANLYRGKLNWYRFTNPETPTRDVYPNRQTTYINQNIPTLFINFDPDTRGIYNANRQFVDSTTYMFAQRFGASTAERLTAYRNARDANRLFAQDSSNRERIWGGFMRLLSSFNTNFDNDNVEYIEIKMKINGYEPGKTKMYLDVGQLSEDMIANLRLNTEDGIADPNALPNGIIDAGEDIGLDMLTNAQEQGQDSIPAALATRLRKNFPYPVSFDSTRNAWYVVTDSTKDGGLGDIAAEPDPSRDDFNFNFNLAPAAQTDSAFVNFNGLEGNGNSQNTAFPDTEVLNRNNGQNVVLDNSFFRYEIDLSNLETPAKNPLIVDKTTQNWYTFRIPVRDSLLTKRRAFGNASLANIQYLRVWWRGGRFKGQIADWSAVGSQWQRARPLVPSAANPSVLVSDDVLKVYFVGTDNNSSAPDFYTLPPGVNPPRVLGNPDPNLDVLQPEQSLAVDVQNLPKREERMAIRYFRPMDLFFYKQIKFFIYGSGSGASDLSSRPDQAIATAFMRFGVDTANYYEYRVPLRRGWQDLGLTIDRITALKQRIASGQFQAGQPDSADDQGGQCVVVGTPTMTRVQFFGFGIRNNQVPGGLSTVMWVNELRLIEPRTDAGFAGVGSVKMQLADIATVTGTYNFSTPEFHRLEERFGSRLHRYNWGINAQTDLVRFIPFLSSVLDGSSLPFTYVHNALYEESVYVPQSDVNVGAAASGFRESARSRADTAIADLRADTLRNRAVSYTREDQFAITGARLYSTGSSWWVVKDIINKFSFNFNYAERYEQSAVINERRRWTWGASATYTNTFPPLPVKPFAWAAGLPVLGGLKDYTIFLTPTNLAASLDIRREQIREKSWFVNTDLPNGEQPIVRNFAANRSLKFLWKLSENGLLNPTVDYSLLNLSTLVPLVALEDGYSERPDAEVLRSIFFTPTQIISLGTDVRQQQNFILDLKPRLPEWLFGKFFDITSKYASTYEWQNTLQQGDFGKGARVNATFNLSTTIRLKDIGAGIFGRGGQVGAGGGGPEPFGQPPSLSPAGVDSTKKMTFGEIIRTIFFDFDRVNINYSSQTANTNPAGVVGGSGLTNFWLRAPTSFIQGREELDMFGPRALYQLGFLENPDEQVRFVPSTGFPFFRTVTIPGRRSPNSLLQDNLQNTSNLDITMQRPLWEGATLALNWTSKWTTARNRTFTTDENGYPLTADTNTVDIVTRTYNRTFLSIPAPFPFLDRYFNSLERVQALYIERTGTIGGELNAGRIDTVTANTRLINAVNEAFEDGLELLPWLPQPLRRILPNVNWAFRWNNLERLPFLSSFVRTASLEHRYVSNYSTSERVAGGLTIRDGTQVDVGFQPLIGINAQFDERALDGLMTGSVKYATRSSYRLTVANQVSVARETSNDFTMQASYTKRNFKLTIFGMDFENDMEFAFQATYKRTLQSLINLVTLNPSSTDAETGQKLDGRTSIAIEPSARYMFSNRVTARAFFRYERQVSEGAAAPGSTIVQFGVDIRLTLAGGR